MSCQKVIRLLKTDLQTISQKHDLNTSTQKTT